MITVIHREQLRSKSAGTARYVGTEHAADISLFWVDTTPGGGPDTHWHPYTETWVVLRGEAVIEADGEEHRAAAGAIVNVAAHTRHRFSSGGTENLEMICIHASPEIIQEFVTDAPA
jgi:mannose-6-phosphate isomerase-like protein (cupin superfamily)